MAESTRMKGRRLRLVNQRPGEQTCGVCCVAMLARVPQKAALALLPFAPTKGCSCPDVAEALTALTGRAWRVKRFKAKPFLYEVVLPDTDMALVIRNVYRPGLGGHFIVVSKTAMVYDPGVADGPIPSWEYRLGRGYRVVAAVLPSDA